VNSFSRLFRPSRILAFLAFAIIATPGLAADLDILDPTPIEQSSFDWSGGYLGGTIGGEWVAATSPSLGTISGPALLGGVFAGYNSQMDGGIVLGAEGDLDLSGFNKTVPCPNPTWACNGYLNALGSLRGRVGYAAGNVLIYGTGGVAVGSIGGSTSLGGTTFADRQIRLGWTAGAGAEAMLDEHWSVRAEYRYTDFGSADMHFDITYPAVRVTSHALRMGVAYHF
jgi:outer membrane immunogenic protein